MICMLLNVAFPGGEVRVVLVVDEVDDGVLEHLGGLCQPLDGGGQRGVELRGGDLGALLEGLGEHGRPDALRPRLVQLLVHLCNWTSTQYVLEGIPKNMDSSSSL